MSVKVTSLCWRIPLQPPEKLVLLRMADYADHDGGSIYPAVATVARDCGISERAVQYILRKFTRTGLLAVVGNETGGRGKTRRYAIDLERAEEMGRTVETVEAEQTVKTVKRAQNECTLSEDVETAQTVQRVQGDAEKGANSMHPTRHRSVSQEEPPLSPPMGAVVELVLVDSTSSLPKPDSRAGGTVESKTDARLAAWTIFDEPTQTDLLGPAASATKAMKTSETKQRKRNHNEPRKPDEIDPDIFAKWEEFRAAYPKRGAGNPGPEGREAFVRRVEDGVDPNLLIAAAKAYAKVEWEAVGTRGIKHYTTFLNKGEEHWLECIEDAKTIRPSNNVHPLRPGQQSHGERQPFRPKHAGGIV